MTTPNDLTALAARMQEAQAEEQRELLEAAWCAVFGEPVARELLIISMLDPHYHRLIKILDAEAYESAALMLIPEEWRDGLTVTWTRGLKSERVYLVKLRWLRVSSSAQTPALAIASAALLAHVENRK